MATAVAVKYWCPVCSEYTENSVTCDACGVAFDVEALKPSHNQLKAEIAALVPEFTHVIAIDEVHNDRLVRLVTKLQQLSAI